MSKTKTRKRRPSPSILVDNCRGIKQHIKEVKDEIQSIDETLSVPSNKPLSKEEIVQYKARKRALQSLLTSLNTSLQRCLAVPSWPTDR